METYLVTGVTGTVGGALASELSRRGERFRALVRDAGKAKAVPGADFVLADLDDAASVERALKGVTRAFLVTNSSDRAERQQLGFVEAAKKAGVRHIVKLSQWAADATSPVRFLRYHAAVEKALEESGLGYTFLRPNLFMQALLAYKPTITGEGRIYANAGDAPVSIVDVRDIAAAAAEALTNRNLDGKTFELTGPEALTHGQIAAIISTAIGKTVTYVDIPDVALAQALHGMNMDPWQADGIVEDYAHYRRGDAARVATGVKDATSREPRRFAELAAAFA